MKANYNKRLTEETDDGLLLEACQWGGIDAKKKEGFYVFMDDQAVHVGLINWGHA